MSTTVEYKGTTLTTVENETKVLNTSGTWLEDDITITDSLSGGGFVTQDANGFIILPSTGSGGSGGSSVQTVTGTFTGSGSIIQTIPCSFAPNVICIYGDLTSDPSLRGVVSITIIKDTQIIVVVDGSTSNASVSLYESEGGISGYNESSSSEPYATYTNGTLTLDMVSNTSSTRFNSSVSYNYKLIGWT